MANIEMLGVKYLELALAKSDYLISNINSNDKEPSWDGTVEIYKNAGNTHSKTDLEGIAKVQVKGHIDSNTTKKSIHYPVETADLRNYLVDGGTIFFVIYIDEDGEKYKIYYKEFLPFDLRKILDKKGEQKTVNVNMNALSTNKIDIANMFKNYIRDKIKQAPAILGDIESVEKMVEEGQLRDLSLGYTKINDGIEEDIFDHLLKNRFYIYSELSNGVSMPIRLVENPEVIETLEEAPVCVKGIEYYNKFSKKHKLDSTEFCFDKNVRYILHKDSGKSELQIDIKGSLETQITNLKFMLNVIKENQIEIGDTIVSLENPSKEAIEEFNLERQRKYLDFLIKLKETLTLVHARLDLDMDIMKKEDFDIAHLLISSVLNGEKVKINSGGKLFGKITIANITLLMCTLEEKGEEGGVHLFTINNVPIDMKLKTSEGIEEKSSIYLALDKRAMVECCNIDYHKMVDDIISLGFSENISHQVNRIFLEMLNTFDETNDKILLNETIRLAKYIKENDRNTDKDISTLNYYQTIKRLRNLTQAEEDYIQEIIENKPCEEAVYVGAYLLLGKQPSAQRHFELMKKDDKEFFSKLPIFKFWK
ncbi:MAG: DUF4365 domain-containing protein [Ruminococcaceae bacterium]|nr:DUF4365 domain-containing protein [Oscillospiraceae bacterium]